MKASSVNINKSIQTISLYLVHRLSSEENCSSENALKKLLKTMTYELLQDKESGLYAESPEYVWSMLQDEKRGDIESWIKE
ncbi:MAG: hypothetical protein J6K48_01500 [Lachnospiraceae bacterium]|nr:hypothetical protein [Lachnospiraceae bacterium]